MKGKAGTRVEESVFDYLIPAHWVPSINLNTIDTFLLGINMLAET